MSSGVLIDAFYNAPSLFWSVLSIFRRRPPTLAPEYQQPAGPDPKQYVEVLLAGSGRKKTRSTIEWDMTMQHTIRWKEPITVLVDGVATQLKPGSCNLYGYPKVTWDKPRVTAKPSVFTVVKGAEAAATKGTESLEGPLLIVLKELFLAIARDPRERAVMRLPDWSGANSVLGLLVANTDAAVDLCCSIFEVWPELMAQPHLKECASGGLFVGENLFHVLAVNSQEAALCRLIKLAHKRLPRELIKDCFNAQATGPFFWGKPMNTYGGTPLAYAASFCMRRAVAEYLKLAKDDKCRGEQQQQQGTCRKRNHARTQQQGSTWRKQQLSEQHSQSRTHARTSTSSLSPTSHTHHLPCFRSAQGSSA